MITVYTSIFIYNYSRLQGRKYSRNSDDLPLIYRYNVQSYRYDLYSTVQELYLVHVLVYTLLPSHATETHLPQVVRAEPGGVPIVHPSDDGAHAKTITAIRLLVIVGNAYFAARAPTCQRLVCWLQTWIHKSATW